MLNICVCDDSAEFIKMFVGQLDSMCKKYLSGDLKYTLSGAFNTASDALEHLKNSEIDLLFLDIDMPEMNGFDLAKRVSAKNPDVMIVFVSAHDHYVFEVFEFSPFAYLRKTKISEELPGILKRIDERVSQRNVRIEIDSVNGHISVPINDILYITSAGNYYTVITSGGAGKITCRGALASVEKYLIKYDFFRIHAAYIVNMDHIQSVRNNEITVGAYSEVIPISQRRLASFRKAYAAFTMRRFDI